MQDTAGSLRGKMKFVLTLSVMAALLVGCVADKMRSYVGQDIRAVELGLRAAGESDRSGQWDACLPVGEDFGRHHASLRCDHDR